MSVLTPVQFSNVTAICKANIYFDGKVVSHAIELADGRRKTLGLIYPGRFRFETGAAELVELVAGSCRVQLAGENDWRDYVAGGSFEVPGDSSFEIEVAAGIAEYVCSYQ